MADLTLKSQYMLAERLARAGEYQEAYQVARRILRAFPKFKGAYRVLGQVYTATGQPQEALDIWARVLSADPEDAIAYAGLGTAYEALQDWEAALWQWQRAFELEPANTAIRQGLQRAHRAAGRDVSRLKMTRGGLARTYLRGRLYEKGIAELKSLLAEEPDRFDLRLALAEALWRSEHQEEAEAALQALLDALPYCLKANLILGHLWLSTDRDEAARTLLERAQMVDPDNTLAQELFGVLSPLPPRTARLPVEGQDVAGKDLGELYEEGVRTIEGKAHLQATPALPGPSAEPVAPMGVEPQWLRPAAPAGEPPWRAQQRHLEAHPEDHALRLALARRLRDMAILEEALKHYEVLVERAPALLEEVVQDVGVMRRLYPNHEGVLRLSQHVEQALAGFHRAP